MVNLSGLFDCYDVERYQYLKKKKEKKGRGAPEIITPENKDLQYYLLSPV